MDDGDIVTVFAVREVVRQIIAGERFKYLYVDGVQVNDYVEFCSAPLLIPPDVVESHPEPDPIRVMVIVTEITERSLGNRFFHWKAAVPYRKVDADRTFDEEMSAILDAVHRFSEGTESLIPAFPVSKVNGLTLQIVEDSFELLAGEGYLKCSLDSSGHYARLTAKGRQLLREGKSPNDG